MKTLTITVKWNPVECDTPTPSILQFLIEKNLPDVVDELRQNSATLPIIGDTLYDHRGHELGQFSIEEEDDG